MLRVVADGAGRVPHDVVVVGDPIGHVGVGAGPGSDGGLEPPRMARPAQFQQLGEVDDLVIAPIPDVGPRVIGFRHLPIDAGVRDTVRVVAVDGGGIDERADHRFDELGIGPGQRLPVLEDVPPVPLVAQLRVVAPAQHDVELVPGSRGIAVSAAEGKRQELAHQAHEMRAARLRSPHGQVRQGDRLGKTGPRLGVFLEQTPAARPQKARQVLPTYVVVARRHPAAHRVEERIGGVVATGHLVGAVLQAVHRGHDARQRGPVGHGVRRQGLRGQRRRVGPGQVGDLGPIQRCIGDDVPLDALSRGDAEPPVDQVGAARAPRRRLVPDRLATAEPGELSRAQQRPDRPRSVRADHGSRQGFAGFG